MLASARPQRAASNPVRFGSRSAVQPKDPQPGKRFPRNAALPGLGRGTICRSHSNNIGRGRRLGNPAAVPCRARFVARRTKGNLHQPGLFLVGVGWRRKRHPTRSPATKHSMHRSNTKESYSTSELPAVIVAASEDVKSAAPDLEEPVRWL